MKVHAKRLGLGMAAAVLVACATVPAVAAEKKFSLAALVPADVFICVAERHNPERAFLTEYWEDVYAALRDSGIGSDIMELITSQLAEDEKAEVERLKQLAKDLIAGVDWSQLGGDEFVFAERMVILGNAADGYRIIMPDIVWMFRGSGDGAAHNYSGMVALFEGIVSEINKAADTTLVVERTVDSGDQIAALTIEVHHGPTFTFSIALHKDTIVMAMGDQLFKDVLGIARGERQVEALVRTQRFQAAFEGLPEAEDGMTFFDMKAMLGPLRNVIEQAIRVESRSKDVIINSQRTGDAFDLSMRAWKLYEEKKYQEGLELVQKAYEIAPDDSRVLYYLACFHALTGDNDKALDFLKRSVDQGFYSPRHIARDPDLESIRGTEGYEAALAKATEMCATHQESAAGSDQETAVFAVMGRVMDVPGMIDYVACTGRTEGYSVKSDTKVALVPGAEKMPFYPVFGSAKKMPAFDRFLPEETLSFSVGGGIDLNELYKFIEDSFQVAGPGGQRAWAEWESIQQSVQIDVRKDVIGWIGGDTASVTLADGGGTVVLVGVNDEELAREKVAAAIDFLSGQMSKGVAANPMLAMLAMRKMPLTDERLPGFESVFFGTQQFVWGVAEGQLIFGSSADAVALCLKTARGEHPGIRRNERVMAEAVLPEGDYTSVSLTDQRSMGKEIAEALAGISLASGFVTMMVEPEARPVIGKLSGMLGKLAPVAAKIDFYKSVATCSSFDGKMWRLKTVTNYLSPDERPGVKAETASSK